MITLVQIAFNSFVSYLLFLSLKDAIEQKNTKHIFISGTLFLMNVGFVIWGLSKL